MTGINGYGAYQNTMMNALQSKQKAASDKTVDKAKENEKLRAARRNGKADEAKGPKKTDEPEVQLSDKAKALLEELKSKYGNMDFFIADYSTEEEAQRYLSRGTKDFSVLIDPETLEAMAADEETKTKYTDMIDKATSQLAEIKDQLAEDEGTEVKRIGITFDSEGNMSMFAELEQISERRREAIAKEREARKAEAEEAEKKAAEKADEKAEDKIAHAGHGHGKAGSVEERAESDEIKVEHKKAGRSLWDGIDPPDEKVKRTIVSATTVEDLLSQIKGVNWDEIEATDARPRVGGRFNLSV